MDPDTQQYLEVTKRALDAAEKSGLLKKIVSWLTFRQQELPEQSVDYREEALLALQENAIETLAGLSLTVGEAVQILEPDFSLDDLDKVNSTWQRHWTGGATKIGIDDEERRTWWANLLAGEIKQPETYSLRTLAVMDTLSTKEAKLFTKICDYVWNPQDSVLILPPDTSALWKPDFSEGTLLESAGLVKFSPVGGFDWGPINEDTMVGRRPWVLPMAFDNHTYYIEVSENKQVRLRCGNLTFTDVGQEMYSLTTPNHPPLYRDEIVQEWRRSHTVHNSLNFQERN